MNSFLVLHCQVRFKMTLFDCYGFISEIRPVEKRYTRLTITTNIPFKTKDLKFNVWDSLLLTKETMEPFKIGEEVEVQYSFKNDFLQLTNMIPAAIDNCPVCYSSLEAMDAQRIMCLGCSAIPEAEHSKRVNAQMKLVSFNLNEYESSKSYKLKLYFSDGDKTFTPVIFENNKIFKIIPELRVGDSYFVIGWIASNGRFLNILDIY